ncbi:hypothetical protein EMIT0373P_40124 [Pseudomonas chlororaphis]
MENRRIARNIEASVPPARQNPGFAYFLTNPLQTAVYMALSGQRTSYPQRGQQTLGASRQQQRGEGIPYPQKNLRKNLDLA